MATSPSGITAEASHIRTAFERVRIVPGQAVPIPPGSKVTVDGEIWPKARDVWVFDGPEGHFCRIFYSRAAGETHSTRPAAQIQVITGAERNPAVADVLRYWRAVLSRLPADDLLQRPYQDLGFVHPESALGQYLVGALHADMLRILGPDDADTMNSRQGLAFWLGQ